MAIIQRRQKSRNELLADGRVVKVLQKYDPYFSEGLLEEVTELYEDGNKVEDIAETLNRPFLEIFMALLHQADDGKITRPFAGRL